MAVHNNKDILMVPYEDFPNEDKEVIGKAIEEFQNKCLLSYTKICDNKVIQKYPLPSVLMHGQSYTDKADEQDVSRWRRCNQSYAIHYLPQAWEGPIRSAQN